MSINVVLVEPEIPQNTGNIIRTCAASGATLHLVRPFGFSLSDKYLKRSGLDYQDIANIVYHDSLEDFQKAYPDGDFFYATTKATKNHTDVEYKEGCFLVFGKETKGLPEDLIFANMDKSVRIPMRNIEKARSLNLSNSVAVMVYEALRQVGYEKLR